jgi:hypothetical protein
MFYTSVWCSDSESEFRRAIPLEILGESICRYGASTSFNVVILEGAEMLSDRYLRSLEVCGFKIIDYCASFRKIVQTYTEINRYYSRYERNCFLRWIAFKEIHLRNPGKHIQFWHLDSDVMLHTPLDDLAADTAGKTFMLQGCPVFVSISDPSWFELYESNLTQFDKDIAAYSNAAFVERNECLSRDAELLNQSLYRNPIGSDQDFLEYLVSSRKIPQAKGMDVFNSQYYFIQNPLSINVWHTVQSGIDWKSQFTMGRNGAICIGRKRVPFTHFQRTFAQHAAVYLTSRRLLIPMRFIKKVFAYSILDDRVCTGASYKLISRVSTKLLKYTRESTINELMEPLSSPRLIDLLNLLLR